MLGRVIKLGGSLLDFEGLVPRLRAWLSAQAPMPSVMIVGGGRLADAIRDVFAMHCLDEEAAHWLCIRLLGVSAELVAKLLPEAMLSRRLDEPVGSETGNRLVILEPEQFLREEASTLQRWGMQDIVPLPHSWDVTSDSIAARVGAILRAEELVLLKSSLPSADATLQQAAEADYVDRYFPTAAACLPRVRCVNLRSNDFAEVCVRLRNRLV
jgi:5-(aminomethyl)-3-furanmethanol phosphate kinase